MKTSGGAATGSWPGTRPISTGIESRPWTRASIIVRGGVGYDNIALEEAGARGIAVCNVPDYGTTEVADHAIGLMLALTRNLIGYWDDLRAEPEAHWAWHRGRTVRRLRDLVFGVVGLGRIGTAAARRAAAFDMDVVFYDPYLPDGHELGVGYRRALSLAQLLTEADVLSVHTPLTEETHNLIDADALHAMKPDAVLVNTARGGVVDPQAVLEALLDGRLGGAGLDVLPQEPLPSAHPLTKAWIADHPALKGRLIVTPHAAFYSPQGLRFLRHKAVATAAEFLRTGVLRNCVNRQYLKQA